MYKDKTPEKRIPGKEHMIEKKFVDFDVKVYREEMRECGLTCREVPYEIRNIGNTDAHNVNLKLELYCKGKRVKINGKEFIAKYLGTIPAKFSKKDIIRISVGFLDGLCILNNGFTAYLTINSNEKNKQLSFTWRP